MLTEEQLKDVLANSQEDIQKAVKARVLSLFQNSLTYVVEDAVKKEIVDFMTKEIVPQLKEHLLANKEIILGGAIKAASGMGQVLSEALIEKMKKKLESSYDASQILESLFK